MQETIGNKRRRRHRTVYRRLRTGLLLAVLGIALWKLAPDFIEIQPPQPAEESPSLSAYPESLQSLWEKNEDARPFVEGYFENKDKSFEIDLSQETQSDTVPLLMQWDQRWGYETYSGGLLGCTGCGPTCLSMAALYLTGNSDYSPKYVAQYATEQGYAVAGSGSAWALISEGSADFGLEAQELTLDESRMADVLNQSGLIVCVLGPGDFTDSGHFIVLTGYKDGAFTVNDPNSYVNSSKTWTYDQLSGQIKNLWGLWAA
ncbi:MAG: C39 family peptidase [Candidatus Onthomonas sp.]